LQSRSSAPLATPAAHLAVVILEVGLCKLFDLAGLKKQSSQSHPPCRITGVSHPHLTSSPFLLYFSGSVSLTFCLGWPWTLILLISTSWVAVITGVNHFHPTFSLFLIGSHAVAWPALDCHPFISMWSTCDYRCVPPCLVLVYGVE
jgi:hypothetical protein